MDDKNRHTESYPRPSQADEQFRNQDEFATQKPNETSPVSGVPDERNGEDEPQVKQEQYGRQS